MQQLAPCPSQPFRPIPYGLVSLWDMINCSVAVAYAALSMVYSAEQRARMRAASEPADRISPEAIREASDMLDLCSSAFAFLDSRIVEARLQKFGTRLGFISLGWSDLGAEYLALHDLIEAELKHHHFYHYPKEKADLLQRASKEWSGITKAFPSATKDVAAAVDCYALGQDHASIHHSMMILEFGLPALARRLRVKFNPDKATWADITKKVRDAITAERTAAAYSPKGKPPPTRSAAKRKSAFLDACEEAAIEFRYFTTVWRNHVAHGRAHYDENDAKRVLEHVRTFMEVIATKLKLKEKR